MYIYIVYIYIYMCVCVCVCVCECHVVQKIHCTQTNVKCVLGGRIGNFVQVALI